MLLVDDQLGSESAREQRRFQLPLRSHSMEKRERAAKLHASALRRELDRCLSGAASRQDSAEHALDIEYCTRHVRCL